MNRKRQSSLMVARGLCLVLLLAGPTMFLAQSTSSGGSEVQGGYFPKKQYSPTPLPQFADLREQLPSPIYEANPLWVQAYWKAW